MGDLPRGIWGVICFFVIVIILLLFLSTGGRNRP